ncbi:PAS domain-containing protein [Sorangium sp. So ce124]|uniref:PAS domain-containing protein n=1 Tax=Sorangium sp. So ce124 TaxID=3133280 RepID=UPI003F5E8F64
MSDGSGSAFTDLFERLPTAVHVYSCDGAEVTPEPRFVAANPAAVRALGRGAAGARVEEVFPALRGAGVPELCARVARSGSPACLGGVRLGGGDDGAPVLLVKAFPLGEGRVGVVFEDISGVKKAHAEELRLLRIACQAAIDVVPDILFVKSADGQRYVFSNKAGAEGVGLTTETIVGKRNDELFPPEVAGHLNAMDERIAAGHERAFFEEELLFEDKRTRSFQTTKVPVRDRDDKPLYLVGLVRDVTRQKEVELDLAKARESLLDTIRQLSTPVLPIHESVLVVPLIGQMDSERGERLTETLLDGIQRHQAEIVIIDITGVTTVDTAVASHVIQATRAAALLGAECVLVGIAPSIAQALVQLGVDFGALITRGDLRAGVAYALDRKGALAQRIGPHRR